jgi:Xaa-Pro aminopeptidase
LSRSARQSTSPEEDAQRSSDGGTSSRSLFTTAAATFRPFLYLETEERRAVLTSSLEDARIAQAASGVERLPIDALDLFELIAEGRSRAEVDQELCVRAVAALGIHEASVPVDFPLAIADRLREDGVTLTPDEAIFRERRRQKTEEEMAGIRRAAAVACRAMTAAASMLREAVIDADNLVLAGELPTAERVRERIREVCARAGAPTPPDITVIAAGPNASIGHEPGAGPLPAHTPIEVDLWPRDERSGCWADMTRTFVRGEISDSIAQLHALVLDAHKSACSAVQPGVTGAELHGLACDVFEAAGHPTQRTRAPDETLREGFYFGLGRGARVAGPRPRRCHSADRRRCDCGRAGTVIPAVGGARVEDLLVVTQQGSECLTGAVPYDLMP